MSTATPIEKSAVGARSTEGIKQTESNKVDPPAEGTDSQMRQPHGEPLSDDRPPAQANEPPTLSLVELIERWMDLVTDDLSPTTVRSYRCLIDGKILPALGSLEIHELTPSALDSFYISLRRDQGLATGTVRHVHSILRSCLAQAVKWGLLDANPALSASPPKLRRAEVQPPDLAQLQTLIHEAERVNPPFSRFLRLMAATGLRRGEACALRWTDVDFDEATLVVRRALITAKGKSTLVKSTKTRSIRRIALDVTTLTALRVQRDFAQSKAAEDDAELVHEAYIFSHAVDGSRPWYPDNASHNFITLRNRLGFHGVRLHDLRHAHATQLLAAGVPVRTVSGRLGHANAATTLGVYAHFLASSDRDAANVITELLG
jgi:integrase